MRARRKRYGGVAGGGLYAMRWLIGNKKGESILFKFTTEVVLLVATQTSAGSTAMTWAIGIPLTGFRVHDP